MQHLTPGVTPGLTTGSLGEICGVTRGLLPDRRDRAFEQGVAAGQAAPR